MPSYPQPAVEKLPLAIRKELRDNWESNKAELTQKFSDLLGRPYEISVNHSEIFPYLEGSSAQRIGSHTVDYFTNLHEVLTKFFAEYSTDGLTHFNDAVSTSTLTITANEKGGDAPVIDCDFKDGVFRILFRYDCFGYNMPSVGDNLLERLDSIPREGFPLTVKFSIEKQYESEIAAVHQEIASILNLPDIQLDPNFQEVYEVMSNTSDAARGWQKNIGAAALAYFKEGIASQLRSQGFESDDMLQEGFAEAVTEKTFKVRVDPGLSTVNETKVEDGIVYLTARPDCWNYNVSNMGEGLIDQL